MVKNPEISRNKIVLQNGARRDVDLQKKIRRVFVIVIDLCFYNLLSIIGNYDDCSLEHHSFAKVDIARHCQLIQIQDVRDVCKSLQEIMHLQYFDNYESIL